MKRVVEFCDRALDGRAVGGVLLAGVAIAYAVMYFSHPLFPGFDDSVPPRGWLTWNDQSRYTTESRAIADLQLDRSTYFYPIGYPLLGAVFVKWMPNNPFFVPNLMFIVAAAAVWWHLAKRWLSPTTALAVGLGFVITHSWLVAQTMVVPWNTVATQCTLLSGIAIVLQRDGPRAVRRLALLAAFTYFVRPIDAVAFAPLLVFETLRLRGWRMKIIHGLAGLAIIAVSVVGVGLLNLWLVGGWRTPYEIASTHTIGFFSYPTSYKIFWLFISGEPLFGEMDQALFFRYPWLLLTPPACLFLIVRERFAGVTVLAALTINLGLYVNYNDLLPSDLYRFTLIHYLAWSFPLLFVLVVAAFAAVRRSRLIGVGFALAIALALVCVGLRLEPTRIAVLAAKPDSYVLPGQRPLLIEFPGVVMDSVSMLRIDGRPLVEYSEYLAPYLPSDLKVLIGKKVTGRELAFASEATGLSTPPMVSEYRWHWRVAPERLSLLADRRRY